MDAPLAAPAGAAPVVRLTGLTKRFKQILAVDRVDLEVQPGDIFGLLGPNGAGKTTIIRLILGLLAPTGGQAVVFGHDPIRERAAVLARTAALVESPALYPGLSGRDNLRALARLGGGAGPAKIEAVLSKMGLAERAGDRFATYSLGMKQRLCIAAAMLTDPQLLILDEPTNGLDPQGMAEIRQLVVDVAAEGCTVLLSSHLLHEVQQVCNRVVVMGQGRVVAGGRVADLLGGQTTIRVRVDAAATAAAVAVLERAGWAGRLRLDGADLVLNAPAGAGQAINHALAGAGIFAAALIPQQQSLEEYYMNLTSRTLGNDPRRQSGQGRVS